MNFKKLTFILTALLIGSDLSAQVDRNVVVEHFTNTRCGICGSRNPGLYTNLAANRSIMHISYHPSSPYSSCVLNKHNTTENDARTRFYNIYGGTPRVVVQGKVKSSSTNHSNSDLFSDEEGKSTPIAVKVEETAGSADSLRARIVVRTDADHSFGDMELFVVAVEDIVFYDAPNGEKTHKDVFRRVMHIDALTLAGTGDSVVLNISTDHHTEWNKERMYVMAFVQHTDTKFIEQVASSKDQPADVVLAVDDQSINSSLRIYPNPANETIHVENSAEHATFELWDMTGQVVYSSSLTGGGSIDVKHLPQGIYQAVLQSEMGA